jgi:plasmid stability protein
MLYPEIGAVSHMNFTIQLPDDEVVALEAKARRQGVSAEQYAREVLEQDLKRNGATSAASGTPISQTIAEIMADAPSEELARLPKDGAAEHDHYLYGWPKKAH